MPDQAEAVAQLRLVAGRVMLAAAPDRLGAEQAVRQIVEFGGDGFEHIGGAVDNRFDQPRENLDGRPIVCRFRERIHCFVPPAGT